MRKLIVLAAVALAAALPASASAHARQLCVPVHATGVGQDLGGGHTTAQISSFGIPLGTTNATFTINSVSGSVASFTGPIVFTARPGTLTAQVAGTLDTATGAFRATSTSVSGTGLFAHVTGDLTFAGNENLATGAFTEQITGQLCV
jgi:hypothetical protein